MKNVMKGMIVFFAVIMIGLVGLLTYVLVRGEAALPVLDSVEDRFTGRKLIDTQTISMEDISDISISGYGDDVVFMKSESDQMVIKQYISSQSSKHPFVTVNKSGNILTIKADDENRKFIIMGSNYRYFEVYLPDTYNGSIDIEMKSGNVLSNIDLEVQECSIKTSSGDVKLQSLNAGSISVVTSSGNVKSKMLSADSISVTTTSGDISGDTLNGRNKLSTSSGIIRVDEIMKDTEIRTSSGDITLNSMNGKLDVTTQSGVIRVDEIMEDAELNTNSGDITLNSMNGKLDVTTQSGGVKVEDIKGAVSIGTSSGDVWLEFLQLTGNLDLKTRSGNITCRLPGDTAFQFQADTASGDIHAYFEEVLKYNKKGNQASGVIGGNSDISVEVQTSSGDIRFTD